MSVVAHKHHEMKPSHVYALSVPCIALAILSMWMLLVIGS